VSDKRATFLKSAYIDKRRRSASNSGIVIDDSLFINAASVACLIVNIRAYDDMTVANCWHWVACTTIAHILTHASDYRLQCSVTMISNNENKNKIINGAGPDERDGDTITAATPSAATGRLFLSQRFASALAVYCLRQTATLQRMGLYLKNAARSRSCFLRSSLFCDSGEHRGVLLEMASETDRLYTQKCDIHRAS
jgi:hypothetical protein